MRRRVEETENIADLEDRIARSTVEIEYYKHEVGARKWPKILYQSPPFLLVQGESRAPAKRPFSSYQVEQR